MKSLFIDLLEYAFIVTLIGVITFLLIGQILIIEGDSMLPNFKDGEQLIAEKVSLKFKDLQRGEVVILKHPIENKLIIKRIIGLPGETVIISNGKVYVDGVELNEPYLPPDTITKGRENYKIEENKYVVLGDNRQRSSDSREWGLVDIKKITGRGFLIYYPAQEMRFVNPTSL